MVVQRGGGGGEVERGGEVSAYDSQGCEVLQVALKLCAALFVGNRPRPHAPALHSLSCAHYVVHLRTGRAHASR